MEHALRLDEIIYHVLKILITHRRLDYIFYSIASVPDSELRRLHPVDAPRFVRINASGIVQLLSFWALQTPKEDNPARLALN